MDVEKGSNTKNQHEPRQYHIHIYHPYIFLVVILVCCLCSACWATFSHMTQVDSNEEMVLVQYQANSKAGSGHIMIDPDQDRVANCWHR